MKRKEKGGIVIQKNMVPVPSKGIKEIFSKLKSNKSPGSDKVTAELFTCGGQKLIDQLQKLLERVWQNEELPKEWMEAVICPKHKKGDTRTAGE